EKTAGTGRKLTLELGGKSPFMVFGDADLDGAVEGLVDAIWLNQGQVCCAGSRLLAEESVAARLEDKIRQRLETFRVGDPLDKAVDMGAVVDPAQRERIDALVQQGVAEGARMWRPSIPMPKRGCFYPPTLLCDVAPGNMAVQEEIFGPVLTLMSFRTLKEGIELANNTRYGLAASVWSENVNRALETAAQLKAGVVWVNCTNRFDAACGFGGYRESGFGREGGREGMLEYLKPAGEWLPSGRAVLPAGPEPEPEAPEGQGVIPIDRTHKHYIGGKQKRADGGLSRPVAAHDGSLAGRVAEGNRKDIRDAVEAAFKAEAWAQTAAHTRAQILYFIAENLSARREEFARDLCTLTGAEENEAAAEVDMAISRLFSYAAWADKFDGAVHAAPQRDVVLAVHEPIGVMGVVCPDVHPLLSFISLMAPVVAMGNRAVIVPSERWPLPATNFYQVLETSDVPAGVVNIVTGERDALAGVLADHDQVEGIWYFGGAQGSREVERRSAGNLKRTWVNYGRGRDWTSPEHGEGRRFLRQACQVKNIWLPYGE
ncbi:MAG: aldehyde dehydrogenase family protein, partial [Alphaproteobacteria bacterium]